MLKTHLVINKVLESFHEDNKRFSEIVGTLHRIMGSHASLQDDLLAPVLRAKSVNEIPFVDEIVQEHEDLARRLLTLSGTPRVAKISVEAEVLQIRLIVEKHLEKERTVLYPLAEKTIDEATLNRLGEEMGEHEQAAQELIAT
jgi:iron-sulfur cluster repair protein YtfE (RIC family)